MKAELCLVCNGKGVVYGMAESGVSPTETCHGCNGKGWIEVSDESDRFSRVIKFPKELLY